MDRCFRVQATGMMGMTGGIGIGGSGPLELPDFFLGLAIVFFFMSIPFIVPTSSGTGVPTVAPLTPLTVGSDPILPERPTLGRVDGSFGFDFFFPELALGLNI